MKWTRREFCQAIGGLSVTSALPSIGDVTSNLRVGVLSDIHVTALNNAEWFEKALRRFDALKVDAVLIAGDLTTWSRRTEHEAVAQTWFKVFPGDRRSDGVKIDRLFVTGNHDVDGWAYGGYPYKTADEARVDSFFFHRQEYWRRLWHEEYRPIMVKTVKGYTFILRNWLSILGMEAKGHPIARGFEDEPNPLSNVMKSLGRSVLRGSKPFFYVQHDMIGDTVNAWWLIEGKRQPYGYRDDARQILNAYPNCLAFTGHSHMPLIDPQSIWQGEFTAVNCSSARGYAFTRPGRENGFADGDLRRTPPYEMAPFDNISVRESMVMDVFDDKIVLSRYDLTLDRPFETDWVIPLFEGRTVPVSGAARYSFLLRAKEDEAPQFPQGLYAEVSEVSNGLRRLRDAPKMDPESAHKQIIVKFPDSATSRTSGRAFDYSVSVELRNGDVISTVAERRVFAPDFCHPQWAKAGSCVCAFDAALIPKNRDIRICVRPYSPWGRPGKEIFSSRQSIGGYTFCKW